MIGRADLDFIDGGEGDDIFYLTPRKTMSVTTGPGNDLVVLDEEAPNFNSFITITDLDENDKMRFYNPETHKYLDVPFNAARDGILNIKNTKDLITPELQVAIFKFATFVAMICDETSDVPTLCSMVDLTDANNNTLA